jgi:hypothetical protein
MRGRDCQSIPTTTENERVKFAPVNGDALRGVCDHLFWHNAAPWENRTFRQGDAVFCKIDEVWRVFRALRRTRKRIVLVTGEGDKPVTPELWAHKPPHVFHWFGTNMFVENPTATPLPLGLGNADGKVTLHWTEIQRASQNPPQRKRLLYANFGTSSNPAVRVPLLNWVRHPDQSWITTETHSAESGKSGYLSQLLSHHFVLCPPGNGEDTHRMWEALYCGAIPVVRESPAMREFKELPILFVPDLMPISEDTLHETLKNRHTSGAGLHMLDASYWKARVDTMRERCRQEGPITIREWLQGWLREIFAVGIHDRGSRGVSKSLRSHNRARPPFQQSVGS